MADPTPAITYQFVLVHAPNCIVCGEVFEAHTVNKLYEDGDIVRLVCCHYWCKGCVVRCFDLATQNKPYSPPACCADEITLESINWILTTDQRQQYHDRIVELSSINPTYCAVRTCSTFIPEHLVCGRAAPCPECQSQTCVECKSVVHEGPCPPSQESIIIDKTAEEAGWQKCPRCQEWRELLDGCNHMTCPHPCHCEFCYCCGMIWKTCQCSHFNNPAVLAIDAGGLDGNGHIPVPLPTPEGFGIEAPLPLRQPLLPYVVDGIDWNAVRIEGLELEENAAVPYNVVSYGWEDVNDNGGVERAEHDDALYLHQEYFPG